MATIYTLTLTTSYYSNDYKKVNSHTSVVGAYQNERDVRDYLMSRVQSYAYRLTENKFNRIEVRSNSVEVHIENFDGEGTHENFEWKYTELELQ